MHWIALQPQPEAAQTSQPARIDAELGGTCTDVLSDDLSDALAALGWWALQFTPKVARLEEALVLEVSASERLWGGLEPLIHQIIESDKPVDLVKYAQGATSLIAIARLQATELARTVPDNLPLAALAAARPHLATLQRIGCTHWGQLRALPRGGVARRFGAPLLDALDRAYGEKPDIYPWLMLPEVFEATLELGSQVETAPALLFGARRLLNQLQVWLQMRQCGVLAFELMWTMDARRDTATQGQLVVRTAEPTGDMAHLQRLLGEHLARITLPAPVLYLRLRTLETQKLGGRSASLLPDEQQKGDSLHQMLERLSARLGPQQVLQLQARADHRPERMQVWQPASDATQLIARSAKRTGSDPQKCLQKDALYPTWLLAEPLKLAVCRNAPLYQGVLTLLAGPQRIETGWWAASDCALRDYFLAHSEQAGLLWIYRERLAGQGRAGHRADADTGWYLHGLFA
jgi:protein ImuB